MAIFRGSEPEADPDVANADATDAAEDIDVARGDSGSSEDTGVDAENGCLVIEPPEDATPGGGPDCGRWYSVPQPAAPRSEAMITATHHRGMPPTPFAQRMPKVASYG